ncbi:MAG: transketolase [Gammaproteobacteria bacterium]|nr:transketolase [Gammaproteobacteria bacterium]
MDNRRELANAIRALSMDAVQQANSGHPGMPMGMADIAEVLWNDYLQHNPSNTQWVNRDRFVVSNGHGSMLLYSLLHLTGYDLSIEDLKDFRQLHSKTPGHPEFGDTPGVETTTGPLGQGIANAVGMALAERMLAAQFNKDDLNIVDHHTYVFVGDGCLMEGISHEACSLAGTLELGKLIVFYDDNGISIDGDIDGWFTDDTPMRFRAYGWDVIENVDGHDAGQIKNAIESAKNESSKPTLICCKTVIGWGAPNKQGTGDVHGAPLGADEIKLVREKLNWSYKPFQIPETIYSEWNAVKRGADAESQWQERFSKYKAKYPELAEEFVRRTSGKLPANWQAEAQKVIQTAVGEKKTVATRKASELALDGYAKLLPEVVGGSADLTPSNNTWWSGSKDVTTADASGNYIRYGVREFGMSAINSGIALHGGFIPYSATFLVFSDYSRNALRMAALMKLRNILVFTHDSIGLGEDGPTHQAVEQTATLRMIPNMSVWRAADTVESAVAWKHAIERENGPTCLIFSRQNLPFLERTNDQVATVAKGGYVLFDSKQEPELILIAAGSEVSITLSAAQQLAQLGKRVRVVSMPSTDVFDQQDDEYKEAVLPASVSKRLAVEAGVSDYWYKYVGLQGRVIGMDTFGASAPGNVAMQYFGFSEANIVMNANEMLG